MSHSSRDHVLADQVVARLRGHGFGALFIDTDPTQGIAAGTRWERELYSALRRSDGVIFIATETSVSSRWCFAELALARSLGTPIFVIGTGGPRIDILSDLQWVDLTEGDLAYVRLFEGMRRVGLQPGDSFSWDPMRCPYPGLRAFSTQDAAVFFGRSVEVHRLNQLVHPTMARGSGRWVSIIGPSGSGKSSLLFAGLLPAISRLADDWVVVPPFVPGVHPTRHLARALTTALADRGVQQSPSALERRLTSGSTGTSALMEAVQGLSEASDTSAKNVLISIDQAEELLTRTGPVEQQDFLLLLSGALREDSPLWVVCTLRSEFLSTAPERAGLSEVTDDSLVVEPLSRARLAEVIAQPARRGGLDFEPGLVERMVEDTTGGDALPLLAYTLHELTKTAAAESRITLQQYEAIGGVIGSLNLRADQLLEELTARGHGPYILPTLLKLVSIDVDGEPIRRRLPRRALTPDEQQVVDAFLEARLLTSSTREDLGGEPMVEVAHEALLRQWKPLRQAVDDSRASLRMRSELEQEVADWDRGGRDEAFLLRGGRLLAIEEWIAESNTDLSPIEGQFLRASRELASHEIEAVRRSNRRLRQLLIGVATLMLVAVGTGIYAVEQSTKAQEQAQLALTRQVMTEAASLRSSQPDLALLLNLEAVGWAPPGLLTDTLIALRQALNRPFHITTRQFVANDVVNSTAFSPDGTLLATASNDRAVRLWDISTGRQRGPDLLGHTAGVHAVAFSSDGQLLATASNDGTVRLWDVATGRPHGEPLTDDPRPVGDVAFSPDGSLVAATSEGGTLRLWTTKDGRQLGRPLIQQKEQLWRVAFSPDGKLVAAAGGDGAVRICVVATGRLFGKPLSGHVGWVNGLDFSPDNATLASAGFDGTVRLWDVASGRQRGAPLVGNHGELNDVTFSPNGSTLAVGGRDSTIRLFDVGTRRQVGAALTGHANAVRDIAFSPDGRSLASASYDYSVRIWRVDTVDPGGGSLTAHTGRMNDVAFSPDGSSLASAGADGMLHLWRLANGSRHERPPVRTGSWVSALAFSPDAATLATASADHKLRLWDVASARLRQGPLVGHTDEVSGVAFGPKGDLVATASRDGTIRLWDAATGQPHGTPLLGHQGKVLDVAFSPDESGLASVGEDSTVRRWDVASGRERGPAMSGHTGWVLSVAYSPDGQRIASGGGDGTVRLWDAKTGRQTSLMTGHTDEVDSVAFRPDGQVLASSGKDGRVRFWEVTTGRLLGEPLVARTPEVTSVAFNHDGTLLAAAGADGSVRLLDFDRARTANQACGIANRNLTQAEWDKFVGAAHPYKKTCPGI